jgi:diaminohydroxyphosphoribosylaminopyrimidine deaminase/5-amino-6-(5-phosphoribosylamino)uracil reductase
VTLEPCCHQGRTGPCTEALLGSGLRRIYVGCGDPHPLVAGGGLRRLRRAGLAVEVGVLESECRELHRGFLSVWERGRPWVTLKLASSLDGRIATAAGESRWITGEPARARVHALRARADGILVGSRTALADDPQLTARRGGRVVHRPVRVLVDSRLRVPASARIHRPEEGGPSWVLCGRRARGRTALLRAGVRLLDVPLRGGHLDLAAGLGRLAEAGLTTLLVEGGGGLAAALLRAALADEIHWFLAPRLLGGDGRAALGPLGLSRLAEAPTLRSWTVRRTGEDLHLHARLPGAAARRRREPGTRRRATSGATGGRS